ncbi:MAG: ABC transporter ATP-binding protein [Candidatus Cloacimonetes bacterium]|nr:ABC transporter ATP-binding protein [Candidatus Cloacimonadota bacterium]
MNAIDVRNVSKKFILPIEKTDTLKTTVLAAVKGKLKYQVMYALKDISLKVNKGEFLGIIGKNGSGKSTLLKIIAGILEPDSGSVKVYGRISPFLELGLGFQAELSARENVFLYGSVLGLSEREIRKKFKSIIEFAGLKEFVDQKLKNFSSGMQVRLAFSVAIQADAPILLADEVLAVGDSEFQQKCFDVFRKFKEEKKTIVFVTHDMGSVRRFCDKVLYLEKGIIKNYDEPNVVIDHYTYGNVEKKEEVTAKPDEEPKGDDEKSHKPSRWGDKKVEITSVKLLDKYGNENETFITGDDFCIEIRYINHANLDTCVFGIAIYDEKDNWIFGTNTNNRDAVVDLSKGIIRFFIKNNPLGEGKYLLTVAAHHKEGTNHDWHDKKYKFIIQNRSSDSGIVILDCDING